MRGDIPLWIGSAGAVLARGATRSLTPFAGARESRQVLNPLTHRKILKRGRPGRGTIVSMGALDRGATSFNLPLTLQVFVEGMTPYEVSDQWMVKAKDCIGLTGSIPIKVDADEPERVAIDWELLRAEVARKDEQRRASLAAMGPVGTGGMAAFGGATIQQAPTPAIDNRNDPEMENATAAGSPTPAAAAAGGDDMISQLERLSALRASGALTEAEFEAQKARILGG